MKLCNLVFLLAGVSLSFAQTKVDISRQGKTPDFAAFPHTRPAQVGTSLPSSCQAGELFFNSFAPAGQNLYGCTGSPGSWALESPPPASLTGATVGAALIVLDAGSVNAYAGCPAPAVALSDGVLISLRTSNPNTGPATLNLCSFGARPIVSQTGTTLAAGAIAGSGAGSAASPLLMYNAIMGTFALLTPALAPPGAGVPYSGAIQNLDLGTNTLHAASVSTGDGTASAALILPELTANGVFETRIYGADNQASSGCIIWPVGTPTTGQVAADAGSTATTTDGKVCRVFTWQTPAGGGSTTPLMNIYAASGVQIQNSFTSFSSISGAISAAALPTGNETFVEQMFHRAATFKNLCVTTYPTQDASGSLVVTLRRNTGAGAADTALTVTQAAGAAAIIPGGFCDLTHSVTINAGDSVSLSFQNNATVGTQYLFSTYMEVQ